MAQHPTPDPQVVEQWRQHFIDHYAAIPRDPGIPPPPPIDVTATLSTDGVVFHRADTGDLICLITYDSPGLTPECGGRRLAQAAVARRMG